MLLIHDLDIGYHDTQEKLDLAWDQLFGSGKGI